MRFRMRNTEKRRNTSLDPARKGTRLGPVHRVGGYVDRRGADPRARWEKVPPTHVRVIDLTVPGKPDVGEITPIHDGIADVDGWLRSILGAAMEGWTQIAVNGLQVAEARIASVAPDASGRLARARALRAKLADAGLGDLAGRHAGWVDVRDDGTLIRRPSRAARRRLLQPKR